MIETLEIENLINIRILNTDMAANATTEKKRSNSPRKQGENKSGKIRPQDKIL